MGAEHIHFDPNAAPKTILLVEDEVLIRLDVADLLRDAGFQVIEAANAAEAVTVLKSGAAVDLVFTDVQMPGSMDGIGLARYARQTRPGIAVLIASGRVGDRALTPDLIDAGPIQPKPYAERLLVARVRQRLGLADPD